MGVGVGVGVGAVLVVVRARLIRRESMGQGSVLSAVAAVIAL